jgi:hypothetical protein
MGQLGIMKTVEHLSKFNSAKEMHNRDLERAT